jgi:hypothetical protein
MEQAENRKVEAEKSVVAKRLVSTGSQSRREQRSIAKIKYLCF